jgi:hypothetical protein
MKNKWNILFLIKAIDTSFYELVVMMNELRSLSWGAEINPFFCINLKKHAIDALKSGLTTRIRLSSVDPNTTLFLRLTADDPTGEFPYKLEEVMAPMLSFDISKAEHVEMFFTKINSDFPAARNMLVTWDHGRGYGINPKLLIKRKLILTPVQEHEITGDVNSTILTIEELALALKNTFGNQAVDVVLFMNCSMHVIDAGYALRNVVDYMVASEVIMDFFGYNYPYIFQSLIHNPDIPSRELARICVSSFVAKAYPLVSTDATKTASSAFFATDLKQYDFVVNQLNRLSKYVIERMPTFRMDILRAREKCFVNEATQLIDFYSFLFELYKSGSFQNASHIISILLSTKDLIVFESYIGDGFRLTDINPPVCPTGFSIFFPFPLPSPPTDFMTTAFYSSSSWRSLLTEISK